MIHWSSSTLTYLEKYSQKKCGSLGSLLSSTASTNKEAEREKKLTLSSGKTSELYTRTCLTYWKTSVLAAVFGAFCILQSLTARFLPSFPAKLETI